MVGSSLMGYWRNKKILVTGGAGFLGQYVIKKLIEQGIDVELIRIPRSSSMDLRYFENCTKAVKDVNFIINLAARVGGIEYNRTHPGSLFYDNSSMGLNLLEAARLEKVEKILNVGSVCAYPRDVPVPTKEEYLWFGYPEESNAAYGLSKKMILVQSKAYREQYNLNSIYVLLANLYGPGDNFNPAESHVIPALIRRMTEAKEREENSVILWGTGTATRDFLYVEDAAEGILQAMENYNSGEPVNLAGGREISIRDLSEIIKNHVGFQGNIIWDTTKPDGQPRRLFDISKAKKEFGFNPTINFEEGLEDTIKWFNKHRL